MQKETIETSISNLENKINLSVSSVKEVAARKNYVKKGEQETLSKSSFSVSGSAATVTEAEFMNMKCLGLPFLLRRCYNGQSLGELEAGEYVISVATAYPGGNNLRPSYRIWIFPETDDCILQQLQKQMNFMYSARRYQVLQNKRIGFIYVYSYSEMFAISQNIGSPS